MVENNMLDIIKKAILLEHRGKALYESVAQKTEVVPVKELFEMLMHEEEKHIDVLNKQFTLVANGKDFKTGELDKVEDITAKTVLSQGVVNGISAAGYEAAVIAAALEFEKNAVKYYGTQESEASSPEEKKLFNWLVRWETEHMTMLAKIDDDLKEQIWYDNSFWPLD
jgi:rubrerythrin